MVANDIRDYRQQVVLFSVKENMILTRSVGGLPVYILTDLQAPASSIYNSDPTELILITDLGSIQGRIFVYGSRPTR
jgi:hypothetical protein